MIELLMLHAFLTWWIQELQRSTSAKSVIHAIG